MKTLLIAFLCLFFFIGCSNDSPKEITISFETNKINQNVKGVKKFIVWYNTKYQSEEPWSVDIEVVNSCGEFKIESKSKKTLDDALNDVLVKAKCFADCKIVKGE